MQCQCGSETASSSHDVKTLKMAVEWVEDATNADLPLTIESCQCKPCGRFGFKAFNASGKLIKRKNI